MAPEDLNAPITEDWLKDVGFKWHQLDRQPDKHWLLWLGDAVRAHDRSLTDDEDIGIELAPCGGGTYDGQWFCWFRCDASGRYHRFIHLRHLSIRQEVILLCEVISGQQWDPANHFHGSMKSPERADRLRRDRERLDRRLREETPWSQTERDPSMGRALPEHLEAHEKAKHETAKKKETR